MGKLKRLLVVVFCLSFIFSVVGCDTWKSSNNINSQASKKYTIVTSFYPMYIFTKNITKDVVDVEVVNMTEPQTGCLHDYQLSTADMKTLENANAFVINGAGMETFMDKVTQQMTNLKIIEASKGIELIKSEDEYEQKHEPESDNESAQEPENEENHPALENEHELHANPHVWVGISGAIQEVKNISEQLALIDTKNAEIYSKNSTEYINKLELLKNKMIDALKDIKSRDVVTFHEAFPYFAKEFNLNVVGIIEKEPGQEPSALEYQNIIKIVKEKKVKVLFTEEQYFTKSAETIAKETGANVYQLDLVVSGPKNADPDSYTIAMEKNLTVLLEALK